MNRRAPVVVAALFVQPGGAYYGLEGVDPWPEERDARLYDGPYPVVAHPPCARWSRLAGFTEARFGLKRGDDGGCFASALGSVRKWGGVLEHPAFSEAWSVFDLPSPAGHNGWTRGMCGGWSCYVEQGRYGHRAKKATWLYVWRTALPMLNWGCERDGESTASVAWSSRSQAGRPHLPKSARAATPLEFRDMLLSLARSTQEAA